MFHIYFLDFCEDSERRKEDYPNLKRLEDTGGTVDGQDGLSGDPRPAWWQRQSRSLQLGDLTGNTGNIDSRANVNDF